MNMMNKYNTERLVNLLELVLKKLDSIDSEKLYEYVKVTKDYNSNSYKENSYIFEMMNFTNIDSMNFGTEDSLQITYYEDINKVIVTYNSDMLGHLYLDNYKHIGTLLSNIYNKMCNEIFENMDIFLEDDLDISKKDIRLHKIDKLI